MLSHRSEGLGALPKYPCPGNTASTSGAQAGPSRGVHSHVSWEEQDVTEGSPLPQPCPPLISAPLLILLRFFILQDEAHSHLAEILQGF